ncbi:TetR/AcrR family transcriptional regulator [Agromyces arachidis]|uniref:TetR/AcrR family transcriptional regulator n=1 Tax=Agromyces arachidis TaxID=766966 RepID=UPI004056F5CA
MPKVSEEYRAARRDEITAAALRRFADKGYRGTSMADIISESGLSAGAIYGHFAGKEELFAAVAERILGARSHELAELRADHGPLAPGEIMAAVIGGMRRDAIAPTMFLQVWGEAAIDPSMRELVHSFLDPVRSLLRRLIAEWASAHPEHAGNDPDEYARRVTPVLMGLAPGYMVQAALLDDFDADAYLATVRRLIPR